MKQVQIGQDVVARRGTELEVLRHRKAELVDQVKVLRIRNRDPQPVARQHLRNCDDTLQHVLRY